MQKQQKIIEHIERHGIRAYEADVDELKLLLENRFKSSKEWSFLEIEVSDAVPYCKHVYRDRLLFSEYLLSIYQSEDIPVGMPIFLENENKRRYLIAPPILERRDNALVICDGMHRFYEMRRFKIEKTYAFVIDKPEMPSPGQINCWRNVTEEPEQLSVENNFIDFNREGLTGYSKFCNSLYFGI